MGTLDSAYYITMTQSVIYLIPEDFRPGNSTLIGMIGALWNSSYRESHVYSPRTLDKIGTGNEKYELFLFS